MSGGGLAIVAVGASLGKSEDNIAGLASGVLTNMTYKKEEEEDNEANELGRGGGGFISDPPTEVWVLENYYKLCNDESHG